MWPAIRFHLAHQIFLWRTNKHMTLILVIKIIQIKLHNSVKILFKYAISPIINYFVYHLSMLFDHGPPFSWIFGP